MVAKRHRRWPSITAALGQCIVLSAFLATRGAMRNPYSSPSKNGTNTQCKWHEFAWGAAAKYTADPVLEVLGQHRRHLSALNQHGLRNWPNIEPKLGGWAYIVCIVETRSTTH